MGTRPYARERCDDNCCLMTGRTYRTALPNLKNQGGTTMSYDTELAALLSEPWNESVCRGYTILALERCGYKTAVIQRVMSELHELLDFTSPQEA